MKLYLVQATGTVKQHDISQMVIAAGDEAGARLHAGHRTKWQSGWDTTSTVTYLGGAQDGVPAGVIGLKRER